MFEDFINSGGDPAISDALTINGQPDDLYNCSASGYFKVKCSSAREVFDEMLKFSSLRVLLQVQGGLPAMEELLKNGMKIQAMQTWGWFTRLIGPHMPLKTGTYSIKC